MFDFLRHKTPNRKDETVHTIIKTIDENHAEAKQHLLDNPLRKMEGGLLYDTSKATMVCELDVSPPDVIGSSGLYAVGDKYPAFVFKGERMYFIALRGDILTQSEESIKDLLAKYDIDAYVKIFGKPELA